VLWAAKYLKASDTNIPYSPPPSPSKASPVSRSRIQAGQCQREASLTSFLYYLLAFGLLIYGRNIYGRAGREWGIRNENEKAWWANLKIRGERRRQSSVKKKQARRRDLLLWWNNADVCTSIVYRRVMIDEISPPPYVPTPHQSIIIVIFLSFPFHFAEDLELIRQEEGGSTQFMSKALKHIRWWRGKLAWQADHRYVVWVVGSSIDRAALKTGLISWVVTLR